MGAISLYLVLIIAWCLKTLFPHPHASIQHHFGSSSNGSEPTKVPVKTQSPSPPDCKSFLDWQAEWLTDRPRHFGRKRGGATQREGCVRYNASTVLPLVTERPLYGCAQSVCAGGLTEEKKRQRVRVCLRVLVCGCMHGQAGEWKGEKWEALLCSDTVKEQ